MRRPARRSLPEEVAEILAAEIRTNRWGGVLPGYRPLCALLGVGRRAVEGALEILTAEQVLLPPDGTRSRRVNPEFHAHDARPKRIRTVASAEREDLDHIGRTILSDLQMKLGREWNFEHRKSRAFGLKRPGRVLDQLVERNPDCRWVFVSPTFEMAKWIERSDLDIICLGGNVRGADVRCLTVYLSDLVEIQVEQLFAAGHRKISIPSPPSSPQGEKIFAAKVRQLFEDRQLPFSPSYNLPRVKESPEHLWDQLLSLFATTPPTAIVALSFDWYLTILSFCQVHRIRVPQDLSLALCASDPLVRWLRPRPPIVEFPVSRFVSALNRWATLGCMSVPDGITNLRPKQPNQGETITRPPKRPRPVLEA